MNNVNRVQLYVNDPDGIYYPPEQVYDAINAANLHSWAQGKFELTTATWTLPQSSDIVSIPDSIMIPQYVEYNNRRYFISGQIDLERYTPVWREEGESNPKWFIRWGHNKIRVWPKPDIEYTVNLIGLGWPTEIEPSNKDLGMDSMYEQAVEHQAAGRLLELARPDLASIHNNKADELAYNFRVAKRNTQSHNIRTIKPATRFNKAQTGNIAIGRFFK